MPVSRITLCLIFLAGTVAAMDESLITDVWRTDNELGADWTSDTSWESGSAPANEGTAVVYFGPRESFSFDFMAVSVASNLDVQSVFFGESVFYNFLAPDFSVTLFLRESLVTQGGEYPSFVYFDYSIDLQTMGDTVFTLGYSTEVEFQGSIYNAPTDTLTVEGGGTLLLGGYNSGTLDGNLHVTSGILGLGNDAAAGDAIIELGDGDNPGSNFVALMAVDGDRTINNPVIVHGLLQTEEDHYEDAYELSLTGQVTLNGDTLIRNYGGLLSFEGGISEISPGTNVSIDADEPVLFVGTSGFTGGLNMEQGVALFADISALPSGPAGMAFTSSSSQTYLGLMIDSATDRLAATAAFLALFNPVGFQGSIGFDTDPSLAGPPNSYSGPIDLTGFTTNRIGTVTRAELTGLITPSGPDYGFGGGGGSLMVGSLLNDDDGPRGVDVYSGAYDPLTVYLNNSANSFTGTVTTRQSALIFGNAPGTLPSGATLRPEAGGYIGIQDTTLGVADYLGQFDSTFHEGIIGFDSLDPFTNRAISDPIDLSGFAATAPDIYLGTSTWVSLSGAITLPSNATDYQFAGFKGGFLDVGTVLTDDGATPRGVVIGDSHTPATQGYEEAGGSAFTSGVRLAGMNTYTGGTRLEAGELAITNNASLGTGSLTIAGEGEGFDDYLMYGEGEYESEPPILFADGDNLDITNPITVNGFFEVDSDIALVDRNLTLSGPITGSGGMTKNGNGTLNLTADNSGFTGGLYVAQGTVNILHDQGAGAGPVGFGGSYSQVLNFLTASPTIGGLYEIFDDSDYYYSSPMVNLASGTQLTLDVNGYDLAFSGSINGDGSVVITGNGSQELSGPNNFTGGLTVAGGATLVADASGTLGNDVTTPPLVTLDGGSLQLDAGYYESSEVAVTLQFGTNGGEINGNGRLRFDDPLAIGLNASISPGNSLGELNFNGPLAFAELGSLQVEIGEDAYGDIISDIMFANTLDITASPANPFSINLSGESGEVPYSFNALAAAQWVVVAAYSSITNFDLNAFSLNVASNLQSAGGDGLWSLSLGSSGTAFSESTLTDNVLMVNFTPIPEPSTYVLLGLGLTVVGFRRRRRRSV